MPVKVRCSGCEKVLNAPDKLRGKTVKCPKCQSPMKIPAPQKKKKRAEQEDFGDDFLSDLDLTHAEDHSQRVCPRCGASIGEDDLDCLACGADLMTSGGAVAGAGGRSPVGTMKRKGPNKSHFYQSTWGDAWEFLRNNKSYAIKTSLLTLILNTLFLCFTFMVLWCINLPPQLFWGLLLFVFFTAPIGWIWHLVTETLKASLAKQSKLKRVNFDFFTCVAYGIKIFAWEIVCGFPILIVTGIVGGMLINSGSVIPGAVAIGIGALLVSSLLPVAMTHMAMPQQGPGWNPLRVYSGWVKSIGAIIYWSLILLITSLPITGSLAAIGATSANKIESFYLTMESNSQIYKQRQKAEQGASEGKTAAVPKGETVALPWNNLVIPGVLLSVAFLMTGPVVVFNARIVGQLAYYYGSEMDLNALEKQLKYVKKKVELGPDGNPIQSGKPVWLIALVVIVALTAMFFVGNFISYKMNDGKTFPSGLSDLFGG